MHPRLPERSDVTGALRSAPFLLSLRAKPQKQVGRNLSPESQRVSWLWGPGDVPLLAPWLLRVLGGVKPPSFGFGFWVLSGWALRGAWSQGSPPVLPATSWSQAGLIPGLVLHRRDLSPIGRADFYL